DRGDEGPGVGLEEVGTHAGDVTHVVTDVVGDHRRVARIVLGDARLDLAHQVGAHVGCLGVDPTTDTGEQGDRGATETYCGDDVDPVLLTEEVVEDEEAGGDAEQTEPGDGEAHDRAASEGDGKGSRHATGAGGLRRAGVRGRCDPHADESGESGEHRPEHVGD